MLKEFKQFLVRGNAIDLAVGVVIGAAFTAVVNALVGDLLTPFIAAVAQVPDFSGLSFVLNGVAITYGKVLNAVISFVLVAAAIFFFVVKPMNVLIARTRRGKPLDPTTKKCRECLSEIPIAAKRCAYCTQIVAQ
ncbi:large conductance mechanosensitive channel protein MscL [Candidatus Kaiserbacteria bacterium CG10_big_fil_rev_8_21_14_0_10_56_12]|uniref:Large-conductance mechanosensitive channel n=1 Tax=Candidatus Kaiserbacteria bacterium CG10_big_fil_rev_8_21_14_0_10_56_12 TaxID=1974611 RepID=A0A2H0UC99_9BACT|nr:MAG: large conductance mechanosensitive channel protein MscL [Candidatus Kaiserbacteria bacterium CG10_big_fil_rev_8_21_14_0_10_56_12]